PRPAESDPGHGRLRARIYIRAGFGRADCGRRRRKPESAFAKVSVATANKIRRDERGRAIRAKSIGGSSSPLLDVNLAAKPHYFSIVRGAADRPHSLFAGSFLA